MTDLSYESEFRRLTLHWAQKHLRATSPDVAEALTATISDNLPHTGTSAGFEQLYLDFKKFLHSDEASDIEPSVHEDRAVDRGFARLKLLLMLPKLRESLPPF